MKLFAHPRLALSSALFLACVARIDCAGLSCYRCTVAPQPGVTFAASQICRHFQEDRHYQTYCPNSTLCMKKTIRHRLGNGTLVLMSAERGCAPQLRISEAWDFDRKKWYDTQEVVTSAYEERCFSGGDGGTPGGPAEYCFCSFHLCNASTTTTKMTYNLTFHSIIALLWMQSIILWSKNQIGAS